ncbi:SET domain-containing protein SmydA-8-like isoform X2 [Penaeus japonicus]|uniref:SET domain-containing protein SmydA-8-like isoform X2 n=1 Tax=Penaeus japonicus TaxID=27405 RepID=UPI001C70DA0C|nr:SET domain-containing protein SmydA-8-like isoform X2 [Penaeus japonicus]
MKAKGRSILAADSHHLHNNGKAEVCNSMVASRTCGMCGTEASLACGGCSDVFYCGKEHQKQHWSSHKKECHPYKTVASQEAGKYLTASRRLREGQVLFQDLPLMMGPVSVSPLVCLGCHCAILGNDFPRCPKCHWPLCSFSCASSSFHQRECPILATDTKRIGPPKGHGPPTLRYDAILLLRCLSLRFDRPSDWETMLDMVSHADQYQKSQDMVHIVTVRYVKEVLKVDLDVDIIHQVRGAIAANSLEIRNIDGTKIRAMYPRVRLLNHACTPNVHLTSTKEGAMEVRTAVSIDKGEPLYICYTGTTLPLWERQKILSDTYFFQCECSRCADPTELGTYYSSPKCPECSKRYFKPHSWVNQTTWECDNCGTERSDAEVQDHVREWEERFAMDDVFAQKSVKQIKKMVDLIESEFHVRHHVWLTAAQAALRELRRIDTEHSLQLRADLWSKLLSLLNVLEPGLSRRRGIVLLESGITILDAAQTEHESGSAFVPQLTERLQLALAQLKEAAQILGLEPRGSQTAPLASKAQAKVLVVEDFLARLQDGAVRAE